MYNKILLQWVKYIKDIQLNQFDANFKCFKGRGEYRKNINFYIFNWNKMAFYLCPKMAANIYFTELLPYQYTKI